MELYEQLLQKADDIGLHVMESMPFESQAKGLVCGDCIALNQNIETMAERACILAEEIIHSQVNTGSILDQKVTANIRQERLARKLLHRNLADLRIIVALMKSGCKTLDEIADKMGITERLLHEAISGYKEEYGVFLKLDDDILFFEPTVILKSQLADG